MAKWKKGITTIGGHTIIAKARAKIGIDYTKVLVGDGIHTEDVADCNAILSPRQTAEIKAVEVVGTNTVLIRAVLKNTDLTNGYWIREIGVFAVAKDDPENEILCNIVVTEDGKADYWPEYEGIELMIPINLSVATGDATQVSAEVLNTYMAYEIGYKNTISGLIAENVQDAIDENAKKINRLYKLFKIMPLELADYDDINYFSMYPVDGGYFNSNYDGFMVIDGKDFSVPYSPKKDIDGGHFEDEYFWYPISSGSVNCSGEVVSSEPIVIPNFSEIDGGIF